jgi:hypothetical protein
MQIAMNPSCFFSVNMCMYKCKKAQKQWQWTACVCVCVCVCVMCHLTAPQRLLQRPEVDLGHLPVVNWGLKQLVRPITIGTKIAISKLTQSWHHTVLIIQACINLRCHYLQKWKPLAHHMNSFRCLNTQSRSYHCLRSARVPINNNETIENTAVISAKRKFCQ